MCASHVRRAAVCAAEARTPRGNPKHERALFPTTRTCAFLKRCPWNGGFFSFFINARPRKCGRFFTLSSQQAVAGTKKKRALSFSFGASRPGRDDRSSRNPSSSQTYPIARRRRRSLARPSLDRPHAFALAREPFSEPSPRSPPASPFRRAKRRRAAPRPSSAARSLPASPAHSCVASPLLVSHASSSCHVPAPPRRMATRTARSATDAREQTTKCLSPTFVARVGVLSSAVP